MAFIIFACFTSICVHRNSCLTDIRLWVTEHRTENVINVLPGSCVILSFLKCLRKLFMISQFVYDDNRNRITFFRKGELEKNEIAAHRTFSIFIVSYYHPSNVCFGSFMSLIQWGIWNPLKNKSFRFISSSMKCCLTWRKPLCAILICFEELSFLWKIGANWICFDWLICNFALLLYSFEENGEEGDRNLISMRWMRSERMFQPRNATFQNEMHSILSPFELFALSSLELSSNNNSI